MLIPARAGEIRVARSVAQSAHRFANRTEPRPITIGTGLAVAGDAHQRQVGIEFGEHVPSEAQLLQSAGPKIFEHDVGLRRKRLGDGKPFVRLEVDRNRLLVARLQIPPQRRAFMQLAPFPQGVALARLLDLDHIGAELRHQPRRERRRDQRAEFEHPNAGEWTFHVWRLPDRSHPRKSPIEDFSFIIENSC